MNFTPTQQRILALLSDGRYHTAEELRLCLYDQLGAASNVKWHIFNLRRLLQQRGEDIATTRQFGTIYYHHVRRIGSASRD